MATPIWPSRCPNAAVNYVFLLFFYSCAVYEDGRIVDSDDAEV